MLQIKNLNMTHRKDLREIVKGFNMVLNAGDKAVIIGEEGDGKSTLLKWIYSPALIEDYCDADGENIHNGERPGYLPQELPREDQGKSVCEYISEDPSFWEADPRYINRLTGELQLEEGFLYSDQILGTLSGGERIKVQMARILLAQPTVLLLDEPSNDLDIFTLKWLEKLIVEFEHIVLFVSHDETLIERTANMVIHMEQLRRKNVSRHTVARLPYGEYIRQRSEGMQKQLQEALNDRRQEKIRQEKWQRIYQKVGHELDTVSRQSPGVASALKKKMKTLKSLEKRYERESENMTRMPESEDAIFIKFDEGLAVPAGKVVLDFSLECLETPAKEGQERRVLARNISLFVKGGEKVCIIGKNGAGKSTLLKCVAEELLKREDIKTAYMPQNYEEQMNLRKTPVDYLNVTGDKEELTRIRTYLGSMKYTREEMERPMSALSGGQKAKVFLLKLSMSGANVLLLDEPTRNFSPLSGPVIRQVLKGFGGAIISASHDRKYIEEVCDKVYCLDMEGLREGT